MALESTRMDQSRRVRAPRETIRTLHTRRIRSTRIAPQQLGKFARIARIGLRARLPNELDVKGMGNTDVVLVLSESGGKPLPIQRGLEADRHRPGQGLKQASTDSSAVESCRMSAMISPDASSGQAVM